MRAPGRTLCLGLATLVLAGCGSQALWARYRAERSFWHARRTVERIQVRPELATPGDFDRAIAGFQAITDQFPPQVWATPARLADRWGRDVATLSGDARLAVGRLQESRGDLPTALDVYRRAAREYAAHPPIRLKAMLAVAAALERSSGAAAATPIYAEIARTFPPVDPETGAPVRAVLEAPLRVASELRQRGLAAAADSVLEAADRSLTEEARNRAGQAAAPELWTRVARVRAERGVEAQLDRVLDALRTAQADPSAVSVRPGLILSMAEYCLRAGRPDSALAYTAWAARDFGREARGKAMMLEARIWEKVNLDSAIAAYDRYTDTFPHGGDPTLAARFRRAELLEQRGRWEQARGEFRAVASASAVHDLSLQASERLVDHHLRLGEAELAKIEALRAIGQLERLLVTVQDEETLVRIRRTRARLLRAIERWPEAFTALSDLWSRYGQFPAGVEAGFEAAALAERELRDPVRAARLYDELATRAPEPDDQQTARRELARIQGDRSKP